ncbi:MAG TPA: LytTR family DNA-binding domain-containing protein [Vicinamibacterales bacterium]|jgi:two-component system LytT family response regulator|nr:LytTR family DNA-binding domain-containing protein [Vicinamibacterales bacterium]
MGSPALPMRVIVVDDEELARALLRELLAGHPDVEIVAECGNGFEAVKAVTEKKPDLLLLDVQMPKLDGFDVLELVGTDVPVIFTTAYDQYAIKAFQVHAVDYLLKPFGAERLAEALARARARVGARETLPAKALVSDARKARAPIERILIRDKADVHVIPVAKIDYIESQDDYVSLKVGDRQLLKEQTLSELEQQLDPGRFVRIHRRYLLNVSRLARIEQSVTDSRVAVLQDGSELPISRSGYAKLREIL